MPQYLIHFNPEHASFRIPELNSISSLFNFQYSFPEPEFADPERPFMIVDLNEDAHARQLSERCIMIKSIHEHYVHAPTWDELHALNAASAAVSKWEHYKANTSFKFSVEGYMHSITNKEQRAIMESFGYMDWQGEIRLRDPEVILTVWEEWQRHTDKPSTLRQIFFGRLLYHSTARPLIAKFDVKKRAFYGNTSMESEMSLLMANQALAAPGKVMYDPFTGTGSMIYTAAHFGATFFGSDIDGRQMRGKQPSSIGIHRALKQYNLPSTSLIDLATFDITWNPWRCGDLFDAIVCDPPYGVRAGAKTLGRKREFSEEKMKVHLDHRQNQPEAQYIPPTKPYELAVLVRDLVLLARWLLKPGGRLVFFLPTVNEDYQEIDIHDFICSHMELVANSVQDFGSWARRLVTIRKLQPPAGVTFERPVFRQQVQDRNNHVPGHQGFREKYFKGFHNKEENV
ncbi:S-adenosyl-L-methionine-dependent methyltransferase [Flagelloscypha sp. PMI_526]|nr:S-adenosyl-L-methionine-dependent methyltransferase [Flagelloscypha sp. PMI_526]